MNNNDICTICNQIMLTSGCLTETIDGNVCEECLEGYVECSECGTFVKKGDITEIEGCSICHECLEAEYVECDECGDYSRNDEAIEIHNGNHICSRCYEESFFSCEECGRVYNNDDFIPAHSSSGEPIGICGECASEYYFRCGNCEGYYPNSEAIETHSDGDICSECYDNCYFTCEECGRALCVEDCDEDNLCIDCEEGEETDIIHSYNYKPDNTFFRGTNEIKDKRLYMGVELEYNHDGQKDCNAGATAWDSLDNEHWYLKHDSSLHCGYEAVSHPHTLAAWHEMEDDVISLLIAANDNGAYTSENTGLHIHLSKKGMTDIHKIRLFAFINTFSKQCGFISRRGFTSWGKFKNIEQGHLHRDTFEQRDRYEALNWMNKNTVEFRFFKSTLAVAELYTCLEFAHAAYSFTKKSVSVACILRNSDTAWHQFMNFIAGYKEYNHLNTFLADYE